MMITMRWWWRRQWPLLSASAHLDSWPFLLHPGPLLWSTRRALRRPSVLRGSSETAWGRVPRSFQFPACRTPGTRPSALPVTSWDHGCVWRWFVTALLRRLCHQLQKNKTARFSNEVNPVYIRNVIWNDSPSISTQTCQQLPACKTMLI